MQYPGLSILLYFLQTVTTLAVNPDIVITSFIVTQPDPVVYQQDILLDITFSVQISNAAEATGDLLARTDDSDNFILKLYMTDNEQYEDATSEMMEQSVHLTDRGVSQAINASQTITLTGVRGQVKVPADNCGAYNYLCILPDIVNSAYVDENTSNSDKCVMFGLQSDGKIGTKFCQSDMDEEESKYGVIVTLEDIDISLQWPAIVTTYRQSIADLVNTYCNINSNFEVCCPGYGSKYSTPSATVVDSSDVIIGRGFPLQSSDGDDGRIMTLVTPKGNNALCILGRSNNARKRRNPEERLLESRVRRAGEESYYLTQSALSDAINEHRDDLSNAVGYDVITVVKTTHLGEDGSYLDSWLIAVIVVCCILTLSVIGSLIWLALPKQEKNAEVYVYT